MNTLLSTTAALPETEIAANSVIPLQWDTDGRGNTLLIDPSEEDKIGNVGYSLVIEQGDGVVRSININSGQQEHFFFNQNGFFVQLSATLNFDSPPSISNRNMVLQIVAERA